MSQTCSHRDGILVDTKPSGLISLRNAILDLIRKYLCPNADQVNPPTFVNLQITQPFKTQYTSPAEELILEIDAMSLFRHTGITDFETRGCYKPSDGKIYLVRNKWCLETLIHETLHACSINSQDPELKRYEQLFDGLTEFFTGYILFQEFKQCYTDCFSSFDQQCSMTYHNYTKLWIALCNFVSLKNVIGIYFPTDKLWDDEVKEFVNRIKNLGFDKFSNPFGRAGLDSITRFRIICDKTFGNSYDDICEHYKLYSDFSKVNDT
ncbi:MAG: hypothetical protein IIA82_08425 [Thaumarchaeota archaeon]|nr:hypothetical protein [Nitrososphaerota archaeon]